MTDATALTDAPTTDRSLRRVAVKVRRHWYWARTQGIGRLIEEDRIDPVARLRMASRRRRWRRAAGVSPGEAIPVFLFGVQRSGTNMVVRGFEQAPEFAVYNENDRRAFVQFRLRSREDIRRIVETSRHRHVLFKPLCDSQHADTLLDDLGTTQAPRAIWAYRTVDGRVASAVAKFGDANLRVLGEIAGGLGAGQWQAERLCADTRALISGFDYRTMSRETAAALFWFVRNSLFFQRGLHERPDVKLVSYDTLLAAPERGIGAICEFLGVPFRASLAAHIEARSPAAVRPLHIDPDVRALCDDLTSRLEGFAREG